MLICHPWNFTEHGRKQRCDVRPVFGRWQTVLLSNLTKGRQVLLVLSLPRRNRSWAKKCTGQQLVFFLEVTGAWEYEKKALIASVHGNMTLVVLHTHTRMRTPTRQISQPKTRAFTLSLYCFPPFLILKSYNIGNYSPCYINRLAHGPPKHSARNPAVNCTRPCTWKYTWSVVLRFSKAIINLFYPFLSAK